MAPSCRPVERLSIVVPVHNEAENVEPLLAEIRAALGGRADYEVIFVDDASTDGTAERLGSLRRTFPSLRIVRHLSRCGQSTAILTGAKAARTPWIVTLDGDGQNDPADIPKLLSVLDSAVGPNQPPPMVCGLRRKRRDSWVKRVSSRIANGVRSRLLRDDTPDTGCGLKLFSRDMFLELPYFDHMHRFLPALAIRNGVKVVSVEVNHRPRPRGKSKYGLHNRLWVGIVDMFGVMWLQRRVKHPEIVESGETDG